VLALSLLVALMAGGLTPSPVPPDDRAAELRAAARARWGRPADSARGLGEAPTAGTDGARYPDRADRAEIQGDLSRLGTEQVERAEDLLRRSRPLLEGISCRYAEAEPAWSSGGQMVYRLAYRCEGFEGGQRRTGVVTLGASFLWRDGRWIEGWATGSPTETDAVSLLPAPQ
jgi:hypothetical protein